MVYNALQNIRTNAITAISSLISSGQLAVTEETQRMFNHIVIQLYNQGEPSTTHDKEANPVIQCRLRSQATLQEEGICKCVVGHLIADDIYVSALEGLAPSSQVLQNAFAASGWKLSSSDLQLLQVMHVVHDRLAVQLQQPCVNFRPRWMSLMSLVGRMCGLDMNDIYRQASLIDNQTFAVAEMWSSANPSRTVPWLAISEREVREHEKHRDFVRWMHVQGMALPHVLPTINIEVKVESGGIVGTKLLTNLPVAVMEDGSYVVTVSGDKLTL